MWLLLWIWLLEFVLLHGGRDPVYVWIRLVVDADVAPGGCGEH